MSACCLSLRSTMLMTKHLLLLLPLLLPACTEALVPAGPALLRRSGPSLRRRGASAAPLLAAEGSEGTPAPAQAAWRLGDELDQRIASLALPAVVSFMILPIAQATDLLASGLG